MFCTTCHNDVTPDTFHRGKTQIEVPLVVVTTLSFVAQAFVAALNAIRTSTESMPVSNEAILLATFGAALFPYALVVTIAYSTYRRINLQPRCPVCRSTAVIPSDAPAAQNTKPANT